MCTIPRAVSPLNGLKLDRNKEHVGRYETQLLIPKLKVSGQPVTSEIRSSTQGSGFGCWLITLPKVSVLSRVE